jgi:Protein of unknown function (DUF2721)
MDPQPNPFAALSLIVAPAILTNASSVLAMSTSNRLARAVDRARDLARQLEAETNNPSTTHPTSDAEREHARRLDEMTATEQRAVMLLHVLQSFYVALGGFASATLASLLGSVVASLGRNLLVVSLEIVALIGGGIGVAALMRGSILLIRETSIAVRVISERAASVRARTRLQ